MGIHTHKNPSTIAICKQPVVGQLVLLLLLLSLVSLSLLLLLVVVLFLL